MYSVLLVDDDEIVIRGLLTVINWEEMGANVFSAKNGLEAVQIINEQNIDLIISDIKMPIIDGIELSKYISDNKLNIEVVLFSAYGEFEYAKKAIAYGVREYFIKPIDLDILSRIKQIVKTAINKKQQYIAIKEKMHSEDFEKNVKDAVLNNDSEKLNEFLDIDVTNTDITLIRDYYCILLEYVTRCIGKTEYSDLKPEWINELLSCNDNESIKKIVLKKIKVMIETWNVERNNNVDGLIKYIKNYIDLNYLNSDMNVSWVADKFGIDLTYLSSNFKRLFGVNIKKYIYSLKMKEACKLLETTDLKAYEIGKKIGYNDSQYFSNTFKKTFGMTPAEYRKKHRELL